MNDGHIPGKGYGEDGRSIPTRTASNSNVLEGDSMNIKKVLLSQQIQQLVSSLEICMRTAGYRPVPSATLALTDALENWFGAHLAEEASNSKHQFVRPRTAPAHPDAAEAVLQLLECDPVERLLRAPIGIMSDYSSDSASRLFSSMFTHRVNIHGCSGLRTLLASVMHAREINSDVRAELCSHQSNFHIALHMFDLCEPSLRVRCTAMGSSYAYLSSGVKIHRPRLKLAHCKLTEREEAARRVGFLTRSALHLILEKNFLRMLESMPSRQYDSAIPNEMTVEYVLAEMKTETARLQLSVSFDLEV